ncbi:MAG: FKBP-type peptidyl-prolyl cis-trans isomerase [Fusicatenibacter sp.]|nr:FKBP-type peptidyl-prolyl cis-trans isomerase [Lachnospiraceae bacterium]MDY2938469.1 FKBP-type peptidyl-prolyl cis-trans isomerase [Fusicatenibacter sp.]
MERKKQEQKDKCRNFFRLAGPILLVAVIVILVIWSILDAKSADDTAADSSSSSVSETDSTDTGTSYSTDSSLTVEDGDTVNIDYIGYVDGEAFDGGNTNGAGTDLLIGSHSYIDDFEEQLIGAHPGDTVEVNVTFPEDYGHDLGGKDALFQVTINGIY